MSEQELPEVVTEDAEFVKISTNKFGALRFKTSVHGVDLSKDKTVSAYAKMYADQVSTDRLKFTEKEVQKLAGFTINTLKDKQRCLKPSPKKSSEPSSKESSTA